MITLVVATQVMKHDELQQQESFQKRKELNVSKQSKVKQLFHN